MVFFSVFTRLPFAYTDEQVHYVRAIGISHGQLLSYSPNGDMSNLGHDIDRSQAKFIDSYLKANHAKNISAGWIVDPVFNADLTGKMEYRDNTSAAPYTPVPYVAYAVGARFADMLGLSVQNQFIVMRLFGAIAALILVYIAFLVAPAKMKWVVLSIALLPASMATFGALTADSLTVSISLVFMAWVMRMIERLKQRELQYRDIAVLGLIAIPLVTSKMPTFLLMALIAALVATYWRRLSRGHKVSLLLIVVAAAVVTLAWAYYARDINTGAFWARNVDTGKQIHFILSHPGKFIATLAYAMGNYDYFDVTFNQYASAPYYGNMPWVVDLVLIAGMCLSPFVVETQPDEDSHRRTVLYRYQLALFLIISVCIFVLLYLQFNAIGTVGAIEGVQPRYFLPYLALLFMTPLSLRLPRRLKTLVYATPFVGVLIYGGFIVTQMILY